MDVKILDETFISAFNKLATHPVQSWEWGEFRKENGNTVVRIGLFSGNSLVEAHQLTVHRLPHTKHKLAMLLKSSIPSEEMVTFLKDYAKKEDILFFRMEPQYEMQASVRGRPNVIDTLRKYGCVPGRRFFTKETFVVDLTKSEDELLASFHPKTRYNIRVATRHGVEVVEETTDDAFAEYLSLTEQTAKRQNFFAHTERYHKLMWKHLHTKGIARLLTAKYQAETLISWILFVWKDTLYYPYGASSEKYRNVMAANLMMWEAIRFGKKLELKKFDLWGKEEGRGFTKFKEGYNPQIVEFVGTWDLVCNKTLYPIYRLAEGIRWKFLKLPLPLPKPSFR